MSKSPASPLLRRIFILMGAAAFAACVASAQSSTSSSSSDITLASAAGESSSLQIFSGDGLASGSHAVPAAAAGGAAAAQDQEYHDNWRHDPLHHMAFEVGGGFNAPIGNDTPYITWGGNVTVGAGLHFTDRISALLEYQFMDNKLPGEFIYVNGGEVGNSHINSITGSGVFDLTPKRSNGIYLVGGYGYYHKSTNFNAVYGYDYFGYPVYFTVASVSSGQMGANFGLGVYHRMGGFMGDGHTQLFAEARYTYIHTPPITQTNGLGTTELIPVTFGIRW